ncbi:uncharacterized protein K444DRAFT_713612 [Hyaloscypha bicolor E]|uniref:ATP-grasp domain-containing protein n=1 Tax=Hyaloscypha bicolor E TaxID=1095630 RepID=A0A2J6TNB6_9HELO|nr:uncharacterized protein K444DRAFT_713612 [Hyaloscypha bicolor E]PMD64515.1 hypothetical protein K444DRAFT_713612 [Hyaloscypha bicolor E]
MAVDESLSDHIIEAIQGSGHKIDGIITLFDPRAAATAKAAERLGLHVLQQRPSRLPRTSFEQAYWMAIRPIACPLWRTQSLSLIFGGGGGGGGGYFPLILKPVAGFLSEGVFLVQNFEDLDHAISAIVKLHGKDALMEPYCDGPEVDANFVLADGEILFFEASDDFPTSAEEGPNGTFIEQANVLPDGIFHLEARVQHSKMHYAKVNGILDLERRPASSSASSGVPQPSAWLIEINPRPPGVQSFQATAITYGVDYIGLSLLLAVGDRERAKILAQPFAQRHQYWSQILFIPTPKGGKFDSENVCAELKERCPDLVPHILVSFCHRKRGGIIPDPLEPGS